MAHRDKWDALKHKDIFGDQSIEELRRRLADSGDDQVSRQAVPPGDSVEIETVYYGISYPWPVSVTSQAYRVLATGHAVVDATIEFAEVPGAVNYEIRVTPV